MIIEKCFKEKFPKISAAAVEFLVSVALKAEIAERTGRALDRAHFGRDALCTPEAIAALASESESYADTYTEACGVLFGAIVAFRKCGQIPEEYCSYEIKDTLSEIIGQYLSEPVAWF